VTFIGGGLRRAPRGRDEVRLAGNLGRAFALEGCERGFRCRDALGRGAAAPGTAGFERRVGRKVRIDRRALRALHVHERRRPQRRHIGLRGLVRAFRRLRHRGLRRAYFWRSSHRLAHLRLCVSGLRRYMRAGLHHREPVHQPFQRLVHGFERFCGALLALGEIALERCHLDAGPRDRFRHIGRDPACDALRGCGAFLARLAHLHGQLLDATLDRAEVAEFLVRRLDPVGDADDLALEMLERRLVAPERIRLVELIGQGLDQALEVLRQRPNLLDATVERLRQFVDAMRKRVQSGRAGALRDVIDARAQRLHIAGERRDAFGRRNASGEFAQFVDRGFQVAQRFGIRRADREAVHLVRQLRDALVEAREAFGRRHRVQALVHFSKAALDHFQRGRIATTPVAVIDALGERLHVALQAFQRPAWQRLMDGARDIGEIRAEARDCILHARGTPQRFDLLGDVVKLAFETGEIRAHGGGRLMRLGCCRFGSAIEGALAGRNLGDRLIETKLERLRRDRWRGFGGRGLPLGGQLLQPGIELVDGVGEPRPADGSRSSFLGRPGEALRKFPEPSTERAGLALRLRGSSRRRISKRRAQPLVDRHAGALRGVACRLIEFGAQTAFIPR
jgi:hypothetical protein